MEETLKATGKLTIVLHDENGVVKETRECDNLVVTVGKGYITSRMIGASATVMGYMEVGTSTTAASAGQTACLLYTSPSPRDRQKSRMPSSA